MLLATLAYSLLALAAVSQWPQSADAWWFSAEPATTAAPSGAGALKALATFNMDGVYGTFKFTQNSASEPTKAEYDLHGLQGNNKLYHVHVKPVPDFKPEQVKNNATALAALCSDAATGGHLNPYNIKEKLPPQSAPFERYELGDLSGKHGPLRMVNIAGHRDHYMANFTDDKLPLSGPNGIVGRSIVIHKNDGKRWVCASIVAAAQ